MADPGGELSRREFLAMSALVSGGAIFVACGGSAVVPSSLAGKKMESALNLYNWSDYDDPNTIKAFQAKFPSVTLAQDTYASNEDMLAKIEAGAKGYDIVVPTGYMVQIMIAKNLLYPIDHDLLPNYKNIDARFTQSGYDTGNRYSVPKDWGTTGFGFRKDKISEPMSTWKDFFGLAPKYSGKISVLDGANETIGSALKYLGYSYNSDNDSELAKARSTLLSFKPHVKVITSSDYKSLLTKGDVWYSMGWNGDFAALQAQTPTPPVQYVIPDEGSEFWVDTWAILKTAPNPVAAHAFINFILDPAIEAQECNYTAYANPETAALANIKDAIKSDPTVYPSPATLAKLESNKPSAKGQRMRDQIYTEFKAA